MKKKIIKLTKFVIAVTILAVGISYFCFNTEKSSAAKNVILINPIPIPLRDCTSQGSNGADICTPLNEGSTTQVKNGELSVGSFLGYGASKISGVSYINDDLKISNGSDVVSGTVTVGALAGTGVRSVCAACDGSLYICGVAHTNCQGGITIDQTQIAD